MAKDLMHERQADVLYLVHRVPYPPDKGDRIRNFHILKYIAQRARLHLACFADEPVSQSSLDVLRDYCVQVSVTPLMGWTRWLRAGAALLGGRSATEGAFSSSAMRRTLASWSQRIQFRRAIVSAASMVPYLRMNGLRQVPAVVDLVDVDSQKWLDYAAKARGPRAWFYRLEGKRTRSIERDLPEWALGVTLVSHAEVDLYRRFCKPGRIESIVNGVDQDCFQPTDTGIPSDCLFVGALDYWPNIHGVRWFCGEVWPRLRACRKDATFLVVGRKPHPSVFRLSSIPGVRVVGQVPDVRPYLSGAKVIVAPLQIARGIQNKILEAMAMARPVVATPEALDGLTARPGTHVVEARDTDDWARRIAQLLDDPAGRKRLGAAGRRFVEQHHCWDECLRPLGRLLGVERDEVVSRADDEKAHVSAALD